MPIYKGKNKVIALYKGAIPIIKKYKGNTLLFDSTPKKNNILSFEFTGTSEKYYINDVAYTATSSPFSIEIEDTITSSANMFGGAANKTITAITSIPDTTMSKDMNSMFLYCTGVTDFSVVKTMNTSSCTNMYQMFGAMAAKELDLSHFDTSNVTDMSFMFTSALYLEKLNVKGWDTKNVTTMEQMFNNCSSITELDLSGLDVSNVTNFGSLFARCSKLKTIDVSGWNTLNSGTGHSNKPIFGIAASSIKDNLLQLVVGEDCSDEQYEWWCARLAESDINCNVITYKKIEFTPDTIAFSWTGDSATQTFQINSKTYTASTNPYVSTLTDLGIDNFNSVNFNGKPIDKVMSIPDTSNVTTMSYMFDKCSGLTTLDVSNWNTSAVTNMSAMFSDCTSLKTLDVSNFNTEKVTDMVHMFNGCSGLTSLDVSNWNTENVTNMSAMFSDCTSLKTLNVSNFNTEKVTSMYDMFENCSGLTSLDVSNWNTSAVTNMYDMFKNCTSLKTLDVSNWNTSAVTDMNYMFENCSGLTSLDVSNWNTSAVTKMVNIFYNCSSITELDVSNWNTSNVTRMYNMFYGCKSLKTLNVSNFNTEKITSMSSMFNGCSGLTSLDLSNWNTENVTNMSQMFGKCDNLTRVDGYISFKSYSLSTMNQYYIMGYSKQNKLRKLTFKDIGYNTNAIQFNMSYATNWGVSSTTITDARQSLVDSLITYSFDRATNGYSTCTVTLAANTKSVLTSDEIAAITAKGFTIA